MSVSPVCCRVPLMQRQAVRLAAASPHLPRYWWGPSTFQCRQHFLLNACHAHGRLRNAFLSAVALRLRACILLRKLLK